MNEIDRRICELKGWQMVPGKDGELPGWRIPDSVGGWSTAYYYPDFYWTQSVAKAFELVGEADLKDLEFYLCYRMETWSAQFLHFATCCTYPGKARNRQEAICLAYIAVRESRGVKP